MKNDIKIIFKVGVFILLGLKPSIILANSAVKDNVDQDGTNIIALLENKNSESSVGEENLVDLRQGDVKKVFSNNSDTENDGEAKKGDENDKKTGKDECKKLFGCFDKYQNEKDNKKQEKEQKKDKKRSLDTAQKNAIANKASRKKEILSTGTTSYGKVRQGLNEIVFRDNEQIKAILSKRDINRILVKGDKIKSVNGPAGFYTAKNDTNGAAYISLYGDEVFTIFISTVKGHSFSLLITPKVLPGRTVVLKPDTPILLDTQNEKTDSYQKSLVELIKGMMNQQDLEEYSYSRHVKSEKVDFYDMADIQEIASYSSTRFLGTVSLIRNKSSKIITLKPSYFYQPGVRAVALSQQTLGPSVVGVLYLVTGRD